jgi:hypothetical protein
VIRVRPPSDPSGGDVGLSAVQVDESAGSVCLTRERKKSIADFKFTAVLGSQSTQSDIYDHSNLVRDVTNGINCCIMAYGCTGSGKTYTM